MKWIIDGHNLIGRMPDLRLNDPHDEEKLLEYLRRYRARTGHPLTVVFDAGQSYRSPKTKKMGGITVQFAPHGKTADQIIMQRLRQIKNPQGSAVVTSDRQIQRVAEQQRVRVVTAQSFAQELMSGASQAAIDDNQRANLKLSQDEIEDWLDLFNEAKRE